MKNLFLLICFILTFGCSNTVVMVDSEGNKTEMDADTYTSIKRNEVNERNNIRTNAIIDKVVDNNFALMNKPLFRLTNCPPEGCSIKGSLEVTTPTTTEQLIASVKYLPEMMQSIDQIKAETNWADAAIAVTDAFKAIGVAGLNVTGDILKANGDVYAMYKLGKVGLSALANLGTTIASTPTSIDNSVHTTTTSTSTETTTSTSSADVTLTAGQNILQDGSTIRDGSHDAGESVKIDSENTTTTTNRDGSHDIGQDLKENVENTNENLDNVTTTTDSGGTDAGTGT